MRMSTQDVSIRQVKNCGPKIYCRTTMMNSLTSIVIRKWRNSDAVLCVKMFTWRMSSSTSSRNQEHLESLENGINESLVWTKKDDESDAHVTLIWWNEKSSLTVDRALEIVRRVQFRFFVAEIVVYGIFFDVGLAYQAITVASSVVSQECQNTSILICDVTNIGKTEPHPRDSLERSSQRTCTSFQCALYLTSLPLRCFDL